MFPDDESTDVALKSIRDAAIDKYGESIAVDTLALFDVMHVLANATRAALVARDDDDALLDAAQAFGFIEGALLVMRILGLPVPAESALDLLRGAEAVLSADPETAKADWLASVERAVDPNIG